MFSAATMSRIRSSLRGCSAKPSLRLCSFEEGFSFDLFGFLLACPFLDRFHSDPKDGMGSWGVYYFQDAIVWCWGEKTKFWHMPWQYDFIRTDVRRADGSWAKRVQSYEIGEPDHRDIRVFDYTYTLRSGEIQHRKATCYVERSEWRRWFLKWTPLFAKVRTSVDVRFDAEVGERTGSWKGGCMGCGITMISGETMEDAVRRMERDREF